uniref:Tc1-like transposase DDE domain-containing protein n=1 Tax=Oncorhynchus tshawytscha TaxID=74940 RepID=A0AAZ3QR74_ONCTS
MWLEDNLRSGSHGGGPQRKRGTMNGHLERREQLKQLSLDSSLVAHPDMTLQHDNATSHSARSVRDFLQNRNVSVLPWPAKTTDLKPIEHIWDLLDRRVRARAIPPRNVRELAGALVEAWGHISQQELSNLVQSMRRRCTAVLNAAGTFDFDPPLFRDTLFHFW